MKPIWNSTFSIEALQAMGRDTLVETLGITLMEIGPDYLIGSMPVDHRTHQTMGILHGGASAALAETLGSLAGNMAVDATKFHSVGIEINANHLRPVSSGKVIGKAMAVHVGRRLQVWQVDIRDERDRLTCVSRLTMSVLDGALRNKQRMT